MPLLEKVERIQWELMMDPRLPIAGILREANAAMGIQPMGSLPEQAEHLLDTMGIEVPDERQIPTRRPRPAGQAQTSPSSMKSPTGEGAEGGASAERKKKKRPPPSFLYDDADPAPAATPEAEPSAAATLRVDDTKPPTSSPPPPPPDGIPWHLRPESCAKPGGGSSSSSSSSSRGVSGPVAAAVARATTGAQVSGARLEAHREQDRHPQLEWRSSAGQRPNSLYTPTPPPRPGFSERELAKQELLFKTRMCRHWELTGSCYHGRNCFFAHGASELKTRPGRHADVDARGGSAPIPVQLELRRRMDAYVDRYIQGGAEEDAETATGAADASVGMTARGEGGSSSGGAVGGSGTRPTLAWAAVSPSHVRLKLVWPMPPHSTAPDDDADAMILDVDPAPRIRCRIQAQVVATSGHAVSLRIRV